MALISVHPQGESKSTPKYPSGTWPLDTPGGRFHAEWDAQAPVTREAQLIFFFQFIQTGGRWEEFLRQCPLHYTGNRGSGAHNIMGTVVLRVLAGHWRYAHINAIRGDKINPGLLGMNGIASEDAVRLAMGRIDETTSLNWLSTHILGSISPARAPVREPGKSRRGKDRQSLLPNTQGRDWDACAAPWSGYTSQRLASSWLMANLIAQAVT